MPLLLCELLDLELDINCISVHRQLETLPDQEISPGGRHSPAVACWASDHWVASSNPLRGKFRH